MISNQEIKNLIECPKQIYKKEPKNGYKEKKGQKKSDLFLYSENNDQDLLKKLKIQESENLNQNSIFEKLNFKIFIRQNQNFIENFSIGLVYLSFPKALHLTRYNGPHDSIRVEDNKKEREGDHHPFPHIHLITEEDINSGSSNPKPKNVEKTKKYNTLEEGLLTFFRDINIQNWQEYFPELDQRSLF